MATLAGAAMLLSVAVALGQREDAALLRECARPYELFLPFCVGPPEAFADYQRDVGIARRDRSRPSAGSSSRPRWPATAWSRPTGGRRRSPAVWPAHRPPDPDTRSVALRS